MLGKYWTNNGGAIAEWSKALLSGEKINEDQKDPGFALRPAQKRYWKNKARKVAQWSARSWVRFPRGQFAFQVFTPALMSVITMHQF